MIMVNIAQAKARLSELIASVQQGERVVLCNRNKPVVELRVVSSRPQKRVLGLHKGMITFTDDCFAPLTDEELAEWGL